MQSRTICSRSARSSDMTWWTAVLVMAEYARTQYRRIESMRLINSHGPHFIIINVSFLYRQFLIVFSSISLGKFIILSLLILIYFRPVPTIPWFSYSLIRNIAAKEHISIETGRCVCERRVKLQLNARFYCWGDLLPVQMFTGTLTLPQVAFSFLLFSFCSFALSVIQNECDMSTCRYACPAPRYTCSSENENQRANYVQQK